MQPHIEIIWPDKVMPPFGLSSITSGMTLDQASRALPLAIIKSAEGDDQLSFALDGTVVALVSMDAARRVGDIVVTSESDCNALIQELARKWGAMAPTVADVRGGFPGLGLGSWVDDKTGWEATIFDGAPGCRVSFLHRGYFGVRASRPGVFMVVEGTTERERRLKGVPRLSAAVQELDGSAYPSVVDDRVHAMTMHFSASTARLLEAAWGPGILVPGALVTREVWFDVNHRYRASLSETRPHCGGELCEMDFLPFVPFEELLGSGDVIVALPSDILGKSIARVRSEYGSRFFPGHAEEPRDEILLPGTEWSATEFTAVELVTRDDIVISAVMNIPYDSSATRNAIVRALEGKWGHATVEHDGGLKFRSKAYGQVLASEQATQVEPHGLQLALGSR